MGNLFLTVRSTRADLMRLRRRTAVAFTVVALSMAALVLQGGAAVALSDHGPVVVPGETVYRGEAMHADQNQYKMIFQASDGNIVVEGTSPRRVCRGLGTQNKGAHKLEMQADGNLVVYTASNGYVWDSKTNFLNPRDLNWSIGYYPYLYMQDDGNLVVLHPVRSFYYRDGRRVWYTWRRPVWSTATQGC